MSITYQEFSSILSRFDERYLGIPLPSQNQRTQRQIVSNLLPEALSSLPVDMVDKIAHHSMHSVSDLFMLYRTSPALPKTRVNKLNDDLVLLENAARKLLTDLGTPPSPDVRGRLACFKQLMTFVLVDYYYALSFEKQLEFKNKISITNESHIATFWDKTKFNLQWTSWKVQAVIGKISHSIDQGGFISYAFLAVSVVLATLAATIHIMFFHAPFTDFIFYKVEQPIVYMYLRMFNKTPLDQARIKFIGERMNHYAEIIYLVAYSTTTMLVFLGPLVLTYLFKDSMSQAQIEAKKANYLTNHNPALVAKWQQLSVKPHLLKG